MGPAVRFLIVAFGFLKFGKVAATSATMLLSLVVYAQIWGWRFAAGFLGLLLMHELGHTIAAWQRGLSTRAPVFIPFVGAMIAVTDRPRDVETEAYVAIGGPFLGTLATLGVYGLALAYSSDLMLAVAYSGFFLNLVNLLPVSPLDGGRITAIVTPRIWLIGAPLMIALMVYQPSPAFILIAFIAAPQLVKAWRYDPNDPENAAYYGVPTRTKVGYGMFYLALAAGLGLMTYNVHEMLSHLHRPVH